jgi:hypothetical protein
VDWEQSSSTKKVSPWRSEARELVFFVAFSLAATNKVCGPNPVSGCYFTGS